jgi:beta-xylosidase
MRCAKCNSLFTFFLLVITTIVRAEQSPPSLSPAPLTSAESALFSNPVIDRDFPDPAVLVAGNTFYAYATNSGGVNVQIARSEDLVNWQRLPDAMPALPPWARKGFTWAPDVRALQNNTRFVLHFTARDRKSARQCIGVASSDRPEGPFVSTDTAPLIAQIGEGGSIDPFTFLDDDGQLYLLWKNDGNACRCTTWIYLQKLSSDGLRLIGPPRRILSPDLAWEGDLVEAPSLCRQYGKYYLFYSGNCYANHSYAIGCAVADSLDGSFKKLSRDPLMCTQQSGNAACGPGGQVLVRTAAGETWMVYHSWDERHRYRAMHLSQLTWQNGKPCLNPPTRQPQLRPNCGNAVLTPEKVPTK